MIRTDFQRQVRALLRMMTQAEKRQYLALRSQGADWAEAWAHGVNLPAIATSLAGFQSRPTHSH